MIKANKNHHTDYVESCRNWNMVINWVYQWWHKIEFLVAIHSNFYHMNIISSCGALSIDGFHPKTSPFSTRHLIWVNYEVLSQLSQPMSILFSYLNSVRHNPTIELCRDQFFVFFYGPWKKELKFVLLWTFLIFSIMHFFTFIFP